MPATRRIAILMHESYERCRQAYVIELLAEVWREDGHDVVILFGTDAFVPADLIIVHVDLSVVPERYLAFARRYPMAVNARLQDIRKSAFSTNLLAPGEGYDGPVIVKTDLNHAGEPERVAALGRLGPLFRRVRRRLGPHWPGAIWRSEDYPIFAGLDQVPRRYVDRPDLVLAKFQPEMDGGLYCVRIASFLGTRSSCIRMKGRAPIVAGSTVEVVEPIELHPEVQAWREALHFDYGKLDYVVVDGQPVLLDVNKTVGCSSDLLGNTEMAEMRRYRAQGLYDYFG